MRKNVRILTENLDCLHESSGIYPYRINAEHLRDVVGPEAIREYDAVICIGLSFDDHGFLGWYKEHHPEGMIIAEGLCQPSYLGDDDCILYGDLQDVLPQFPMIIGIN